MSDNRYKLKGGRIGDRSANLDAIIKINPSTLARLRAYCHNDKDRPDTPMTYDELVNRLLDKVQAIDDRESSFIESLRNYDLT